MNITEDKTYSRHTRAIHIKDGPVMPVNSYSHRGKQFVADLITAEWSSGVGLNRVDVSGALIKKDGKPGEMRGESYFYLTPRFESETPAPDWIADLFA